MNAKSVLMVALDPASLPPSPSRVRSPEEIAKAGSDAKASLVAKGYEIDDCLLGPDDDPGQVEAFLRRRHYDIVLIGAGLRVLPEHTVLFERVINLAPFATLSFNSSPSDSEEAVLRAP